MINQPMRDRIISVICQSLSQRQDVLAGWEGGSAAFGALDDYSDIDLNMLVNDDASMDLLHAALADALNTVSPITISHPAPPGRYYQLRDGGEFLLVDVCFVRVGASGSVRAVERHGQTIPLFDKGHWLHPRPLDEGALAIERDRRFRELEPWYSASQSFVRKAIARGQHVEARTCYWGYTLRPLAELLRMRHCAARWDFGMRYLDRDLPPAEYARIREFMYVCDLADLAAKLPKAEAWGAVLLQELDR
jgi:hypothetical protein